MSLGDQSQQWYPTSVQVTVLQGRNLRIKGKNGTNDAYAIMQVAKDKFSTSVADKCVAPVWKEEATFDLPLFHQSNAERCTLYIIVMHRAQVGLDKHLGQAVINLIELHDNKSRKKTDWFKLVDKNGKEDKVRGEVLLDIQFMRNNMSASMFDLSMQDKPRSRIAKLKDKVRGKKKEGFSDSASAIVPSVSQVLTDSEGEEGARLDSPEAKKKSKLKSLFTPKSNLQRNISQSMSTLGTLPEKNSSLSGSRSSGLNADSPDVKKKFKFLGHKRTGSNDSKVSLGPFSLLGRSKQSPNDQNNLCINGSHVYAEEAEPKSGSTLSLNSSGQGSVEDVRQHNSDVSVDSLKGLTVPSYRQEQADRDRALVEQRRHLEEEESRQAEERRRADAKRLQEEEEEEERKRQAEQERKKRSLEEEAWRKQAKEEEEERRKKGKEEEERRRMMMMKSKEEEEERRRQGEEQKRLQAEEARLRLEEEQRQQEETKREEERKRLEEASMSDRLSTLFGIIKKKEEPQQQSSSAKEEVPKPSPRKTSGASEVPSPQHSTNPFEEIPLSPDTPNTTDEAQGGPQKPPRTSQVPSAMVFLNRTAKVSAVKPRLVGSKEPESPGSHTQGLRSPPSPPSPPPSETSLSSIPSDSPVSFSSLHFSLAPPNTRRTSESLGSTENLNVAVSHPKMSDKKRQAPLPPSVGNPNTSSSSSPMKSSASGGSLLPITEGEISGDREMAGAKHAKRPALPLPDYESLFPVKRHGVQGQTRWDHIIAEVNQKQRETMPQVAFREMSVDGPEDEPRHNPRSVSLQPKTALLPNPQPTQPKAVSSVSYKKQPAPAPPKPVVVASPRRVPEVSPAQKQSAPQRNDSVEEINVSSSTASQLTPSREVPSVKPKADRRRVIDAKAVSLAESPNPPQDISESRSTNYLNAMLSSSPKATPTAKPRQKVASKEPVQQANLEEESVKERERLKMADPAASPVVTEHTDVIARREMKPTHNTADVTDKKQILERIMESKEKLIEPDPFPSTAVLPTDTRALPEQSHGGEDLFTGRIKEEKQLSYEKMTPGDQKALLTADNSADVLSSFHIDGSAALPEQEKADKSDSSPFRRNISQRKKLAPPSVCISEKQGSLDQQDLPRAEGTMTTTSEYLRLDGHKLQVDPSVQDCIHGRETVETKAREEITAVDQLASLASTPVPSVLATSDVFQPGVGETSPQPGVLSGGKTQLKAWVSPSEAQLNSSGGVPALTPRRPHPVKPMNTGETQPPACAPACTPAGRELKTIDFTTGKIRIPPANMVTGTAGSGPYSQLTQEELITLVVKQQTELTKKNDKIVELEEYIDNLLVRVIEEKPSILLGINASKHAL